MSVRKIAFALMFLIWISLIGQAAAAEENCSLSLTFSYRGTPVNGGSITLYNVTGLAADTSAQTAQALAGQLSCAGETKAIKDGLVQFDGLAPGLYLLAQQKSSPNFLPISPFLIALPMEQSGALIRNVSAAPKMAPYPTSPETGQPRWPFAMLWVSGTVLAVASIGKPASFRAKNRLR